MCVVVWSNTDFDYCRASSMKLELGVTRRLIVKRTIYWFGENIQKYIQFLYDRMPSLSSSIHWVKDFHASLCHFVSKKKKRIFSFAWNAITSKQQLQNCAACNSTIFSLSPSSLPLCINQIFIIGAWIFMYSSETIRKMYRITSEILVRIFQRSLSLMFIKIQLAQTFLQPYGSQWTRSIANIKSSTGTRGTG